jgi:nucleotide-binding universal stress UspA family protein
LAAIRAAVREATLRRLPLYAVRVDAFIPERNFSSIDLAFADALGGIPPTLEVHEVLAHPPVVGVLAGYADQPDDLLVVGTSGRGRWRAVWSGSIARSCVGKVRGHLLVVPAPALARYRRRHWWPRRPRDLWTQFDQETVKSRS